MVDCTFFIFSNILKFKYWIWLNFKSFGSSWKDSIKILLNPLRSGEAFYRNLRKSTKHRKMALASTAGFWKFFTEFFIQFSWNQKQSWELCKSCRLVTTELNFTQHFANHLEKNDLPSRPTVGLFQEKATTTEQHRTGAARLAQWSHAEGRRGSLNCYDKNSALKTP